MSWSFLVYITSTEHPNPARPSAPPKILQNCLRRVLQNKFNTTPKNFPPSSPVILGLKLSETPKKPNSGPWRVHFTCAQGLGNSMTQQQQKKTEKFMDQHSSHNFFTIKLNKTIKLAYCQTICTHRNQLLEFGGVLCGCSVAYLFTAPYCHPQELRTRQCSPCNSWKREAKCSANCLLGQIMPGAPEAKQTTGRATPRPAAGPTSPRAWRVWHALQSRTVQQLDLWAGEWTS